VHAAVNMLLELNVQCVSTEKHIGRFCEM